MKAMTRLTPERIKRVWASAVSAYGLDPVLNDTRASQALFRQPLDLANLPATLSAMAIVRDKTPEFFEAYDYDWAFEPTIWQKSLEANYQSRALQHLTMVHRSPYHDPNWQFGDVVLRYAFQTDALFSSPFHLEHQGLHFVTVPFAFNEVVLLLFAAFVDSFAGLSSDWTSLQDTKAQNDGPKRVSPYLKHLFLRMLTTDGFHPALSGEPPMDVAKKTVSWFSDAAEVYGAAGPLLDHLTLSLIDYALAHELGHRILGHSGVTRLNDAAARTTAEIDADRVGFHLYTTSWGWRDELLDDAPLGQLARILLGPITFGMFERWYAGALSGLAAASLRAGVDPGFDVTSLAERRFEAEQRMTATFQLVSNHQTQCIAKGATFTMNDNHLIVALTRHMVAFQGTILDAARSVPEEAVRAARTISLPLF